MRTKSFVLLYLTIASHFDHHFNRFTILKTDVKKIVMAAPYPRRTCFLILVLQGEITVL